HLIGQLPGRPTEMGLEDLPNVHAARHAKRVEYDVDRGSVSHVGHVPFGKYPREHALVPVPAGHLVTNLELALDGDEYLDHLDDARRELVPPLQALHLLTEHQLD